MEIRKISNERGIYAIYDGQKYLIYSEFYGMVAKSTKIERDNEKDIVNIDFIMCDWSGYWDLAQIIKRGVAKLERQWVYKKVNINIQRNKDGRQNLKEHYIITEDLTK
jgi:hypothetical protein